MTRLELTQLNKQFGTVTAVKDISLTVEPGSLVALLGPSGCGKTTTLRMIAGLEEPTSGNIRFDDMSVLNLAPDKRNIGMVFQRYVLFPHMTVEKNISFGLRMRGQSKTDIAKRVAEVLEIVQLTGFEKRFPSQLSGGQQQRVAIARTVITDPRLLLMDEPLSNLDAKLREEMRAFITDLQKRLKLTTVFVTHDQIEAIELADKIAVMFDGEIVQFGTPEDIFNRPVTTNVAYFMGATNLIEGKLLAKGSATDSRAGSKTNDSTPPETTIETPSGLFYSAHEPTQAVGTSVTATVRPEHIDMRPTDKAIYKTMTIPNMTKNNFRGKVLDAVYYGGSLSYNVEVNQLRFQVRENSSRRFSVGEEVLLSFSPEHLWIFPK